MPMQALDRKLLRELRASWAQSLSIAAVIASGVAVFVMALGTLDFLQDTRDAYYDRYRFADLFASVNRAPQHLEQRVAQIPGVAYVQSRIVADVTLDVPELEEPAVGRIISLPRPGDVVLNDIYLRMGRMPLDSRRDEVLVSEAFFEANSLRLGDRLTAVLNEREARLVVVGVALSPEFVFAMRPGDILPDNRRFGVCWMAAPEVEAAFNMRGAFNNITVRLQRGANHDEVIARMDALLRPYGNIGTIGRDQQISARFLADEIKQLRATALVAPTIFLGVAAFLLNLVLTRSIGSQRIVIAALKAFGYSNFAVGWHYLKSSLLVALVGSIAGTMAGFWMGSGLANLYAEFYRFPEAIFQPNFGVAATAILVSMLSAAAGSTRAVMRAVTLPPADAMRPASPLIYRPSIVDRFGLGRFLPITTKMVIRGIERRPIGAALSSLGIGMAVSVMVLSGFADDALDFFIEFQFTRAQRQDVQVTLNQVTSPSVAYDIKHLPGVQRVEPFRAVAVVLRHGHRSYRTSILGLDAERELFRLLDTESHDIALPPSGIVLGDGLAKRLGVGVGQSVRVEVLEGEQPVRTANVQGIAKEFAGMGAYMDRAGMNRWMHESDVVSGGYLAVDSRHQNELYRELKRTPRVAAVLVKSATVTQFRETIAKNQRMMQSFTAFFAVVIAVGVVYSTARISVEERARELATLRVIGFTNYEVATILLGELAVITVVAVPIGWLIGYGFTLSMIRAFESELFRLPLVVRVETYAWAACVVGAASAVSGLIVQRRIARFDLVDVLKSHE